MAKPSGNHFETIAELPRNYGLFFRNVFLLMENILIIFVETADFTEFLFLGAWKA
jgi:hypothetical protein